jgi:hypothetical protein
MIISRAPFKPVWGPTKNQTTPLPLIGQRLKQAVPPYKLSCVSVLHIVVQYEKKWGFSIEVFARSEMLVYFGLPALTPCNFCRFASCCVFKISELNTQKEMQTVL